MTSTHTAELNLRPLPRKARLVHLFPALQQQNTSLLSIGKLCDAGCKATFTADQVTITLHGKQLLTGHRCPTTGLWLITLPTPVPLKAPANAHAVPAPHQVPQANSVTQPTKAADMVAFSHAALFSPTLSTLQTALDKGYVIGFPGLTSKTLKKYPPQSVAMHKGHMDQTRANQQSTKEVPNDDLDNPLESLFPTPIPDGLPTDYCFAAIVEYTGKVFTDQTGKFPVRSQSGNNQLLVLYAYDANYIHAEPMPNKSANSILKAYQAAHTTLVKAGLRPKLQRLDNECSKILKDYMHQKEVTFQLTPPGMHRRNAAERAIRTFKNHLIAGLCSTDPKFPLYLWDKLLPQALITLNLLRGSRLNPKLSAYSQVHGHFDFNTTPMGPPGTHVVSHDKPSRRASWDAHGDDAWYIGPAMDSYRCFTLWVWRTKGERTNDTIEWFPHYVKMPTASTLELIFAATQDILKALATPMDSSPLAPLTDSETATLKTVTQILQRLSAPEPPKDQQVELTSNNPILRVPPSDTTTLPPPTSPPAPVLRVNPTNEITHQPTPPIPDTVLRVPVSAPTTAIPEATTTPTSTVDNSSDDTHYNYHGILQHRKAPRGSGSLYEVHVNWEHHQPSWVTVNVFTSNHLNITACETLAIYAQKNNLLNTKGWRGFQQHLPSSSSTTPTMLTKKQQNFFQTALHATHVANKAINPDTGKLAEYGVLLKSSDGKHWEESCCEEIGRLAQGYLPNIPEGTDTMHFIRFDQIPKNRKATYLRLVVADRPTKANPRRVRFTVGGDKVNYPGQVATKTADLPTAKLIINSTISTPGAKFMGIDIKDFYLNNPMDRYEYMRVPIHCIPQRIIDQYNLEPLIQNGAVYVEIRKGMYGLPQAGRIASDNLIPVLRKNGYHQSELTPGLFKHESRPVAFCLVVDDFGVKYVGREHAEHLAHILQEAGYTITMDWEGKTFCGINLDWDYENRTVDLSMPGYVDKALQRFEHPPTTKPEHAPHAWTEPQYGAKTQMTSDPDSSPPLDKPGITRLQEVIGTLLYYARAIDNTMLVALGTLAAAQSKGTQSTADACTQLLNYAASHPDAILRYTASDMILHCHSDASYLSAPEARSRAGGIFFLSDNVDVTAPDAQTPKVNGAVHIISKIMNNVMASATEAEVGALFHNAQDACMLRTALDFLGHPQPATPIQTDNACAEGIINDTVKQKRSKAIDMRFYWVRDRVRQGQFNIHWKRGQDNLADYFTKHFPASHHQEMRPIYLHEQQALSLVNWTTNA